MRYRIDCAYHGRHFHGWQKQPGLRTVQGELEEWLTRTIGHGQDVSITGAGRTDAGVHSLCTPAHFDIDRSFDPTTAMRRIQVALPDDLCVTALHRVADSFHSRYDAAARAYTYRIRVGNWPFNRDREWQVHAALDESVLRACADLVIGTHDFSGFCRAESRRRSNACTVSHSEWRRHDDSLVYAIRADRFLHEMIRLMVGTFVAAARGRWGPDHVTSILRSGNVEECGDAAPPHGLTLERVEYPSGVGTPVDFD